MSGPFAERPALPWISSFGSSVSPSARSETVPPRRLFTLSPKSRTFSAAPSAPTSDSSPAVLSAPQSTASPTPLFRPCGRALQPVAEPVDHIPEAHQPSPSDFEESAEGGPLHCQSVSGSRNASGVTVDVETSSAACDQAAFTSSWPDVKDSAL